MQQRIRAAGSAALCARPLCGIQATLHAAYTPAPHPDNHEHRPLFRPRQTGRSSRPSRWRSLAATSSSAPEHLLKVLLEETRRPGAHGLIDRRRGRRPPSPRPMSKPLLAKKRAQVSGGSGQLYLERRTFRARLQPPPRQASKLAAGDAFVTTERLLAAHGQGGRGRRRGAERSSGVTADKLEERHRRGYPQGQAPPTARAPRTATTP